MQNDVKPNYATRAMLAGVFSGVAGLFVSLVFNYVYRYFSGYALTEVFNVVFMTVGILLTSLITGIIYSALSKNNKGLIYFDAIIIIIALICIGAGLRTHRGHNPETAAHFKILFTGVIIITSCFNALGIPYLTKHKNVFF